MEEKFDLHMKENLGNMAELKSGFNRVAEAFTLMSRDLSNHSHIFDRLSSELESFKAQKDQLKAKLDGALDELDDRVSILAFNQFVEKTEGARSKE
jgi:hypothetical protein